MPVSFSAISLFTGAMGLDLGFEQAGFEVRASVDKDRHAVATVRLNRPNVCVFTDSKGQPRPIEQITTEEILIEAGLAIEEASVVIGAPPCEPYSTAGRRNGKADQRADAVFEFIRVIREARPRFFVMEEVPSFMSAARRHISFYDRIAMNPDDLDDDLRLGSFYEDVMAEFGELGYELSHGILNAADFGLAQKRKRFILIGAREGTSVSLPSGTVEKWQTFEEAMHGLEETGEFSQFPNSWGQYLHLVPPGGCWRNLPEHLQKSVLGGAYDDPADPRTHGKKGGRTGFMRRLAWDAPAPTVTDSPTTKGSCLCHPGEVRPLSVNEYARLQGFPDDWVVCGSTAAKYRLIGQATPVALSAAVAHQVRLSLECDL